MTVALVHYPCSPYICMCLCTSISRARSEAFACVGRSVSVILAAAFSLAHSDIVRVYALRCRVTSFYTATCGSLFNIVISLGARLICNSLPMSAAFTCCWSLQAQLDVVTAFLYVLRAVALFALENGNRL
jgi:hypothetical protein